MNYSRLYLPIVCVLSLSYFVACSTGSEPGNDDEETPSTPSTPETPSTPDTPSSPTEPTWKLVFEDDFEGTSKEPNTEYWTLCEKGTDSWNRYLSGSYDQAYQQDGTLYLVAEMVDEEYLTGGIETRGKFDFMYGKVECRARFQRQPKGNHTGIWMMPSPPTEKWPKSGEIDIMEHLGADDIVYQTVHSWYLDDMDKDDPKGQGTAEIDNTEWNTYGLIWNADSLVYTINGEHYLSYPNLNLTGQDGTYQWPFNHNFYIILSQSLGGKGTWAGAIDDAELPAIFEIDWIKVYQEED